MVIIGWWELSWLLTSPVDRCVREEVLEAVGGRLETAMVQRWGDHPAFLDAVAAHVRQALAGFPAPERVQVLFTAHSLPERILANGDPYPDELRASATAVAKRVSLPTWRFAFQSAGATPEPWLGPEAGSVIRELAAAGHDAFLIVPIGFVCDHVEILYDVDIEYRACSGLGVRLEADRLAQRRSWAHRGSGGSHASDRGGTRGT